MAARFINSPGVNLNTLATLATLQEQNKLAAKRRSQEYVSQIVGGLANVAGTAINARQQAKQREYKQNWEQTQWKLEHREPLTTDEAGSLGLFDENGVPMKGYVMPEKEPKPEKMGIHWENRPDGLYATSYDTQGNIKTTQKVENVPGKPISENLGYMNYLDKQEQERIRKAERLHADAVRAWRERWMWGNRIKPGAPPQPNLSDYYRSYNIGIPATIVGDTPPPPPGYIKK